MEPTPQALQDLDLNQLVGRSVDEARAIVEAAGGVLRTLPPNAIITLEYRPDRVTVTVVDGEVLEANGIG